MNPKSKMLKTATLPDYLHMDENFPSLMALYIALDEYFKGNVKPTLHECGTGIIEIADAAGNRFLIEKIEKPAETPTVTAKQMIEVRAKLKEMKDSGELQKLHDELNASTPSPNEPKPNMQ